MIEYESTNHCKDVDETTSCFNTLTPEQTAYVEANKNEVIYYKGETILKQGTFSNSIMYLKEGLVKLSVQNRDKYIIITLKKANHFIGFETYRNNINSPYTVTALEDSKVCLISKDIIGNIINQNSVFANEIFKVINANTIITYDRLFSLTQKQLHGRLADILLCLSNKIYKNDTFDLPLSRKDLAALTSMAPESVIRILKDFKLDGLIKTSSKTIQILNKEMLMKISAVG